MEKKFRNGTMQAMEFSDGSGKGFGGEIVIAGLVTQRLRLALNTHKRKETSSDYFIEIPQIDQRSGATYWAQAGWAWFKTPLAGGDKFFSLRLDRPDLPSFVDFAAFKCDEEDQPKKGEGGEKWRFTYSRPRASTRAAQGSGGANKALLPDDKIPF